MNNNYDYGKSGMPKDNEHEVALILKLLYQEGRLEMVEIPKGLIKDGKYRYIIKDRSDAASKDPEVSDFSSWLQKALGTSGGTIILQDIPIKSSEIVGRIFSLLNDCAVGAFQAEIGVTNLARVGERANDEDIEAGGNTTLVFNPSRLKSKLDGLEKDYGLKVGQQNAVGRF